jgi:hypothetical protein
MVALMLEMEDELRFCRRALRLDDAGRAGDPADGRRLISLICVRSKQNLLRVTDLD